jgi:hypothetical protein
MAGALKVNSIAANAWRHVTFFANSAKRGTLTEVEQSDVRLDLCFAPNASLIGAVRRFVVDFFERVLTDQEMGDRLGLVAHELLENAIKYSQDPGASVSISIFRESPSAPLCIQTRNVATKTNIAHLSELMAGMQSTHDAMLFYQTLMRDTARRTEGSGLGLARIWAEGDMRLTLTVENENEVVLSAITPPAKSATYPASTTERT